MPCIPLFNRRDKRIGFLCVGNEPIKVGKYLFEWTESSGWVAVNKDGSERLSHVPKHIWNKVDELPRPKDRTWPPAAAEHQ